ncbi:Abi-alpha family protein [Nocardioides sp. LML1-1-1.1]|uniref:Abi-alpha family protein n=1 Tax=Nocardioides sp. LML1-1-1.1 TaxID=3135248 RepID=UPI00343082DA
MTEDLDKDGLPRLPALTGPAVAESLPGLARVAGSAALHTAGWGVRTTTRNWLRVGKAVTNRDEAALLIRDVTSYVGALGEVARQVSGGVPVATALMRAGESLGGAERREPIAAPVVDGKVTASRPQTLRERGNDLLAKSRDVWSQDDRHPAFDRILDELAPDEARILVMLLRNGPQPSVDVRTGGPIGVVSSQLIAPGLNMVGPRAGLRYLEQVPSYLNNLFRLGLVWFSREPVHDHMEYQVLEAQPDVLSALHSVKFAKVVRRSIHLTPFGEEFCKLALVDEATAQSDALPEHEAPPDMEG